MSHVDLSAQTARLKDILLSERNLLLTGRARDAAALMPDKMDAIQDIEAFLADREPNSLPAAHRTDMEEIVRLSRENSAHFEAIRNGLRHAIERLESMHGSAYVGSYAQNGTKIPFTEVTGQFRRKA
ncbi:hypothetical protein [Hyphomonas sp.]|uniref:hypothetical protein n=1 Tax=Hyphomonas sp. TaxID=87 RepID=UPI003F6F4C64